MVTCYYNGNLIEYINNKWYYEDGTRAINLRPCPKCKNLPTKDGHDACIANLPGVNNACCGHGVEKGYIQFENGLTIRGKFNVEQKKY